MIEINFLLNVSELDLPSDTSKSQASQLDRIRCFQHLIDIFLKIKMKKIITWHTSESSILGQPAVFIIWLSRTIVGK